MMFQSLKVKIITVLSVVLVVTSAWAATEIIFSDNYSYENVEMGLQGQATKSVIFRPAFVSGLYLPDNIPVENVLGDHPKRLEVHYLTKVPKERLTKYTIKKMRDNLSKEEFQSIEDKLEEMDQYFVTLAPGDKYAITYIPQVGTKFEYNGNLQGIIEGEKFGKGVFSVWLGRKPMDKKLKKAMLGLKS